MTRRSGKDSAGDGSWQPDESRVQVDGLRRGIELVRVRSARPKSQAGTYGIRPNGRGYSVGGGLRAVSTDGRNGVTRRWRCHYSAMPSSTAQSVAMARAHLTRLGVIDDPYAKAMLRLPWRVTASALRLPAAGAGQALVTHLPAVAGGPGVGRRTKVHRDPASAGTRSR